MPFPTHPHPSDVMVTVAALQDQIDDLVTVLEAQQRQVDDLAAAAADHRRADRP